MSTRKEVRHARRASEEAQRYLDQLRAEHQARLGTRLGTLPAPVDEANQNYLVDYILGKMFSPEQVDQYPQLRAQAKRQLASVVQDRDGALSEELGRKQENIEKSAARRITGGDLSHLRPLVGYLETGQLNAVTMRVPGRSGAYLVTFEDQLSKFAGKLSKAVAWAIPYDGETFEMGVDAVTERIEANPDVVAYFAAIVVTYAVTGSLNQTDDPQPMRLGYHVFADRILSNSLDYFVLGHEYAHILHGHLETTATRKGVLPATEAEALAYSWQQELDADRLGMGMAINAYIEYEHEDEEASMFRDISGGFLGIGLFFGALDVMDRAVALLETGDENARQLGSHPPSDMRMQHLRGHLPKLGGDQPAGVKMVQEALKVAEVQQEIIRLLWERTRPILLDLHRRGVPAARKWRPIPKETGDEPALALPSAPAPKHARRPGWRWGHSG